MSKRTASYPAKRSMNLYYKPDRTTKPATIGLYVLFVLTCLLGLSKFLIYDVGMEALQAQQSLAAAEAQLESLNLELADYEEVWERYSRYSATDEERALIDRMEVLALLDQAVGASLDAVSISGETVQLQFSGVTLAQTAQIVSALEASPIVAYTMVNTAATTQGEGGSADASAPVQASVLIQLQKGGGPVRRQLTTREWLLLALLGVLLLVSGYMLLFYMPQTAQRDRCLQEAADRRVEIEAAQLRLEEKRRMEQELEALFSSGTPPLSIADYDNLQPVMFELNAILAATEDYSLSFSTVDASQPIVRRSISMSFTTGSYASAKAVLQRLHDSAFRCMLESVAITIGQGERDAVSVSGSIVFFEYQAG